MAEQKESSVLFSLKELMNLEEDRIKQETEDKKRRAETEAQTRLEAERRAREQEQARLVAEEDRRRNEEQRKKEDVARLEAIRHAEIEKARVEAEQRARIEAMTKQQEHERHLKTLQHDEHKKKLQRMVLFIGGGAAIVIALGLGWYFGVKQPADRLHEAQVAAERVKQEEDYKKLQKQFEDQQAKVGELMQQLATTQDEKTRAELRAKLADAQRQQQTMMRQVVPGAKPAGDKPKPPCNCQPGDPLCSCL